MWKDIEEKRELSNGLRTMLLHFILIVSSIIMAFPFFWMISNSIKTKEEIWKFPPVLLPKVPQWNNYVEAFNGASFARYIFNSTYTSLVIVVIVLINSAMIAYALTQLEFRGKKTLFGLILCTYMLPSASTYIPSYIILGKLNLLDTHTGLIISCVSSVFGIFFLRQAFLQINKSIVEAAKIDGAGHFRTLWRVIFPMTRTSFVTLGLLTFIGSYNSYLWPSLIIKSPDLYLVNVGLRQFFTTGGAYGLKWGVIMAASTIIIMPLMILFLVGQKWFINGITGDSSVKG